MKVILKGWLAYTSLNLEQRTPGRTEMSQELIKENGIIQESYDKRYLFLNASYEDCLKNDV
jgi:hypothetical protein